MACMCETGTLFILKRGYHRVYQQVCKFKVLLLNLYVNLE